MRPRYASDKPDLRYGLEMADLTAAVRGCAFRVFAAAAEEGGGGIVKAIRLPEGQRVSNSRVKPKGDVCGEPGLCGQCCCGQHPASQCFQLPGQAQGRCVR